MASGDVTFSYQPLGSGWAEATVSNGSEYRSMNVSNLSDALGDMTAAVLRLLQGSGREEVSFLDEPGEHVWTLRRQDAGLLIVEVKWFEDWIQEVGSEAGQEVFLATCSLLDFAREIRAALDRLLERYGIEGYSQKWLEHEFPATEHAHLAAAIGDEESEGG